MVLLQEGLIFKKNYLFGCTGYYLPQVGSSLWCGVFYFLIFLVAACKLLVEAGGIWFPES